MFASRRHWAGRGRGEPKRFDRHRRRNKKPPIGSAAGNTP
jgi:hypothetical protein